MRVRYGELLFPRALVWCLFAGPEALHAYLYGAQDLQLAQAHAIAANLVCVPVGRGARRVARADGDASGSASVEEEGDGAKAALEGDGEQEDAEAEAVIGKRSQKKATQYQIKWRGYPEASQPGLIKHTQRMRRHLYSYAHA